MGSPPQTLSNAAASDLQRFLDAYRFTYDNVLAQTQDGALATEKAAEAASAQLKGSGFVATLIGLGVSLLGDVLAVAMDQITQVKKSAQPGLHDLIATTLSDALLIEVDPSDIPNAADANGQFRVNAALGGKFLNALKTFMGASGEITAASAETSVQAFMGFGMQLAVNTGFLAMIGGAIPFEHFNELKEIGEMLEKSLGLGRLTRQFLAPYLTHLVQAPLNRSLAAKALQALPGVPDLVNGLNQGVLTADQFTQFMNEHGFNSQFTTLLLNRHTPRLDARELVTGEGYGFVDQQTTGAALKLDGIPDAAAATRLTLLRAERKAHLVRPLVEDALRYAREGLIDDFTYQTTVSQSGLPQDEQAIWQQRLVLTRQHAAKKLSQGDMLFLFEAAQITLADVQQWAQSEGYSFVDQQRLELFFSLKAAAASNTKTGGAAAKAAHAHIEHTAYVTDEITGLWGRAPNITELTYWVNLLDLGERTKADFKAELKALPTSGPAIP